MKSKRNHSKRKWSGRVHTASTFPPEGTFTGTAQLVARTKDSRRVSLKSRGSGIRIIQLFINRAGKNLPESRRRTLERATHLLQKRSAKTTTTRKAPSSRKRTRAGDPRAAR